MQTPRLEPVEPYLGKRNRYTPKVGDPLTIELPGERARGTIVRAGNSDMVHVEISSVPIGKTPHGYRKGDICMVKRGLDSLGVQEAWVLVSDRDLEQMRMRADIEREQQEADAMAENERVAALRARDLAQPPRKHSLGPRRSKITKSEG